MPREPALAASGDRMSKRSRHGVSEGPDARSERPATGQGAGPGAAPAHSGWVSARSAVGLLAATTAKV
jgi:hypothetical protein